MLLDCINHGILKIWTSNTYFFELNWTNSNKLIIPVAVEIVTWQFENHRFFLNGRYIFKLVNFFHGRVEFFRALPRPTRVKHRRHGAAHARYSRVLLATWRWRGGGGNGPKTDTNHIWHVWLYGLYIRGVCLATWSCWKIWVWQRSIWQMNFGKFSKSHLPVIPVPLRRFSITIRLFCGRSFEPGSSQLTFLLSSWFQ